MRGKNKIVWKFGWASKGFEKLVTLIHFEKKNKIYNRIKSIRNNKNIIQVNKWVSDKKK